MPTSLKTEAHADAAKIDPDLNIVKGCGGSLLREKMIESAAARSPPPGCTGSIRKVFDETPGFSVKLRTTVKPKAGDKK